MSDAALMLLAAVEVTGLIALYALVQWNAKRRVAGKPRHPRPLRILAALVGLVIVVGAPAVLVLAVKNPRMQSERQHETLVQTGTPATATITQIEETGMIINYQPQVQVQVIVHPQDAPAFHSQSTRVFSVKDTQTYRVGATVNVFFDPKDHGAVALVGLAPSGGPAVPADAPLAE